MKKYSLVALFLVYSTMSFGQKLTKQDVIKIVDSINESEKEVKPNTNKIHYYHLDDKVRLVKYGTPLAFVVENINPFLTKSFAGYKPIDFDFSTDSFTKLIIEKPTEEFKKAKNSNNDSIIEVLNLFDEIAMNKNILNKLEYKFSNENIDIEEIENLESEIIRLKTKITELNNKIKKLIEKNDYLKKKYDSIYNVKIKSAEFKTAFKEFQTHFDIISKVTNLKALLERQINKDSVFIKDVKNFKNRATSNFKSIYADTTNYQEKKDNISLELTGLQDTYVILQQKYQELNKLYKNDKLTLSGELKSGKTALKFKNVIASIETEPLFAKEMGKAKAINDSLIKPEIKKRLISEAYEGIDLYDEILNTKYTDTIISKNIYTDEAIITPQLKNSKGKVMHTFRDFKIRTYGRWKINGSAGYFLNFTTNDNYTLRKKIENDSSSLTGIQKGNKDSIKGALGGLLHVYYDFKGDIDLGASVGLSIGDNSNTAYYLGLSGFFTEKSRLVITTGLSFSKVDKLNTSNLNFDNGQYNFINESDTEIKYDNVYRPSLFIGITYNVFKKD